MKKDSGVCRREKTGLFTALSHLPQKVDLIQAQTDRHRKDSDLWTLGEILSVFLRAVDQKACLLKAKLGSAIEKIHS